MISSPYLEHEQYIVLLMIWLINSVLFIIYIAKFNGILLNIQGSIVVEIVIYINFVVRWDTFAGRVYGAP